MTEELMSTEKEIFLRHIQRAGLKRTAQRELILDVFLRSEEHLSSEDLYRLVQREDPNVGQTTVYRTLKLLTDAGLAREVRLGDGRMRYEPTNKFPHHDHMICTQCGHTVEFYSAELLAIQKQIAEEHGYKPTQHNLRIFGICSQCQNKANAELEHETTAEPRLRVAPALRTRAESEELKEEKVALVR